MRTKLLSIPASLALFAAGSVLPAQALLTYNIFETTDGNVVVETSGSLILPNADFGNPFCDPPNGTIISSVAAVCTGNSQFMLGYFISGPKSFNGTVNNSSADAVSGISTVLVGISDQFGISEAYVSGTPIESSATFNNTTLKGLGFTTTGLIGTWEFVHAPDQKIQVVLTEVPGPLPLVGAGAAFAFSRRLRRRIASSQAATPPQA